MHFWLAGFWDEKYVYTLSVMSMNEFDMSISWVMGSYMTLNANSVGFVDFWLTQSVPVTKFPGVKEEGGR